MTELNQLRAENARLREALEDYGHLKRIYAVVLKRVGVQDV